MANLNSDDESTHLLNDSDYIDYINDYNIDYNNNNNNDYNNNDNNDYNNNFNNHYRIKNIHQNQTQSQITNMLSINSDDDIYRDCSLNVNEVLTISPMSNITITSEQLCRICL